MEQLESLLGDIAGIVWGWPLVILLFGTHIFLTLRTGFIQRLIGKAIKISFGKQDDGPGDISQFGSLATALAATIGTGNIIGVATAIVIGGPGAVLWMWLTGVLGIATKYGEALLAVKYRTTDARGQMCGGPMYVLEKGMNAKWLAVIFAIFTAIAAFGIGNMVQANAISTQIEQYFVPAEQLVDGSLNLPRLVTGSILAVLTGLTLLGGIKSISRVCQILVPFMAGIYIVGCLALLAIHFRELPGAFTTILSAAFSGEAAAGGLIGVGMREVMRFGIARGLFSNEAGLGSAPIVAAAAKTPNPVRQALVSASGTFWDTVVVCLLTGLVFVASGYWQSGFASAKVSAVAGQEVVLQLDSEVDIFPGQNFELITQVDDEPAVDLSVASITGQTVTTKLADGSGVPAVGTTVRSKLPAKMLTNQAFSDLPVLGPLILTVGLLTFVLSTILGWSYYGEKAIEYLLGERAIAPYRVCWVVAVLVGSLVKLSIVWNFSDIANGMMAIPNLISLVVLSGVIASETRKHIGEL